MNLTTIEKITAELNLVEIDFELIDDQIHIPLPYNFDTLVIEIWQDGEDSISLLNGDFHTHGDIEAREYGLPSREKGILHLVESIFNGKFKLAKRVNALGKIENKILDSFSLALLDEGHDYEFVSEVSLKC
ncbi:hypothetical protein FLL45_09640 [Aliikangiella marina]|uniref:Uncharacterized protein n=1 Tax=Aliikangiella marina TaxID=1712262 RepID=A0A545TDC8_9GAMM|nr:hypothetical protein [Aliikangiella marina]TQV75191.1 hypothetical protein FLL45_09640 [Aliikangiella marina]